MKIKVKLPDNKIIENKKSITIVGANGSGKTRISVWIEQNNTDVSIHRISAQKSLNMPENVKPSSIDKAKDEFLYGTADGEEKWKKEHGKNISRWRSKPEISLLDDFEKLMQLLFTDDYQKSREYRTQHKELKNSNFDNETILDKTKKIFEELLLHRNLRIDAGTIKAGADSISYYNGSQMSDGEREVFYFVASVLAVPQDSIVIIDEPENHLHNSILNKLWNSLEKSRKDCLFIYITHNLDFAVSRINTQIVWVKKYLGNKKWDFELVNDNFFPEALQLQILGNRQNILFVEGDSNSYDVKLYSILFEKYNVIPVKGCDKVIQYTMAINDNSQFNYISAKGIIDKDRRSDEEIANYKSKNIYVPKVTEIENIFLLPEIIKKVASHMKKSETEISEKLNDIQSKVLKYLDNNKEAQALLFTQAEINSKLEEMKNLKTTDIDIYKQDLINKITQINFGGINIEFINKIEQIILENNYEKALGVINHKGIIQDSGLTSFIGMKKDNYIDLALGLISENQMLQEYIRKYIDVEDNG